MVTILELFSGTESVSNVFRECGHDAITVDIDPQFNPTHCCDIRDFDSKKMLKNKKIDAVWASPDCSVFSVASLSRFWKDVNGVPFPRTSKTCRGLENIFRTFEIIKEVKPKVWYVENPRGMLRSMPIWQEWGGGEPVIRHTVTYCQYGDTRMKPTDIWTNSRHFQPKPPCKNGDTCHEPAPRGSKTGTQGIAGSIDRARIPYDLCLEICIATESDCYD